MVISALWLKERSFPAVRVSPIEIAQPLNLLGCQTSVWQWIVADEPGQDSAFAFGQLLRRFHDLPATDAPSVPDFDQMTRIRQRFDRIPRRGDYLERGGGIAHRRHWSCRRDG